MVAGLGCWESHGSSLWTCIDIFILNLGFLVLVKKQGSSDIALYLLFFSVNDWKGILELSRTHFRILTLDFILDMVTFLASSWCSAKGCFKLRWVSCFYVYEDVLSSSFDLFSVLVFFFKLRCISGMCMIDHSKSWQPTWFQQTTIAQLLKAYQNLAAQG